MSSLCPITCHPVLVFPFATSCISAPLHCVIVVFINISFLIEELRVTNGRIKLRLYHTDVHQGHSQLEKLLPQLNRVKISWAGQEVLR